MFSGHLAAPQTLRAHEVLSAHSPLGCQDQDLKMVVAPHCPTGLSPQGAASLSLAPQPLCECQPSIPLISQIDGTV